MTPKKSTTTPVKKRRGPAERANIIVRFHEKLRLPNNAQLSRYLDERKIAPWKKLETDYPGVTIEPVFRNIDPIKLKNLIARAKQRNPLYKEVDFFSYYRISCPVKADPKEILKRVTKWGKVSDTYIDCRKVNPLLVNYTDDPNATDQGHLDAAPSGISAKDVWTNDIQGSNGNGIKLIDIETGWTLNHEDLGQVNLLGGTIVDADRAHGTSVLGIVGAKDNTIGCVGVAPNSTINVYSHNGGTIANAILQSALLLNSGDVLLIEAVNEESSGTVHVPVETTSAEFDAVKLATDSGIIVVEAGGDSSSGGINFNTYQDTGGMNILYPSSGDFKDSGAIIVTSAQSAVYQNGGVNTHIKMPTAPYGDRVDCFAWGENITTLTSDSSGSTNLYTDTFNGTSGAAAIIAGAILSIQGMVQAKHGCRLTPEQMCQILRNSLYGTRLSRNTSVLESVYMPNLQSIYTNVINNLSIPTVTISSVNVSCHGTATGSATANVTGGTAPYTYHWEPTDQATATATGLTAGTHTVMMTDASGFNDTESVVITEPDILTAIAAITSPVLCSLGTGTITISASGGTPPYSFTFNGATNGSGIFNNISAGTGYAWSVTDANGCGPVSGTIDVTAPSAIIASAAVTSPISCNGNYATVKITASGGTPPYTYTFNGVTNSTGIFANIPSGNGYPWSVTDENNCGPFTGSLDVYSPTPITAGAAVTIPIRCNGGTATVTLTASGGTPPYTFSFNNSTPGSNNVFSGIAAGSYSWSVNDANGCGPVTGTLAVIAPAAISVIPAVTTPIRCPGGNATVTLMASGGTPPYSYTFNGVTNNTGIFSNIPAGNAYAWSVRDANYCGPVSGTMDVTEPSVLVASAAITTSILCCGGSATITITASGGTPPYSYSFNGSTPGSNNVFNGVAAGSYSWRVTDINGCGPVTGILVVTEPTALSARAAVTTPIRCNGGTATITLTASGGTPPYTFSFNNSTPGSNNMFSGVAAGSYGWSISDANGCGPVTGTLAVTEPATLSARAAITTPINCNGGSAIITITASGGTPPYSYSFNGSTPGSNNVFSGIVTGTYSWSVTDANSCGPVTGTLNVPEPSSISAVAAVTTPIRCNGRTATVTITPGGGTPPYTITLVNNSTNPPTSYNGTNGVFTGIPAGTYTWTVTDTNGCAAAQGTVIITEPAAMTATVSFTDVICYGANNGSITISNATGGSGSYEYSIDGGTSWQSSPIFSSLRAIQYDVRIRDSLTTGCVVNLGIIRINEPARLNANVSHGDCSSAGNFDGFIIITNPTGGHGTYEYSIDGGNSWQTSGTFNSLPPATYDVRIRDAAYPLCFVILSRALSIRIEDGSDDGSDLLCKPKPLIKPCPKPDPFPRPDPFPKPILCKPKPIPCPDPFPKPGPLPDVKPGIKPGPLPDPRPIDPRPLPDPKPIDPRPIRSPKPYSDSGTGKDFDIEGDKESFPDKYE